MIIIEGPDNSGKTTLVNKLSRYFNLNVRHSGGPPKTNEEMMGRLEDFFSNAYEPVLRDRSPIISEYVFGNILSRNSIFKDNKHLYKSYLRRLLALNPLIIYCCPPTNIMKDLSGHQKGLFDTDEHFASITEEVQLQLIAAYHDAFRHIPHIKYNYAALDADLWYETILKMVDRKLREMDNG